MELKYLSAGVLKLASTGSNRTFMELKFSWDTLLLQELSSSNRTFMELKYLSAGVLKLASTGSNRTFMELKFV